MNNISSPDFSDAGIERRLQAKGLTAPRVTMDDIKANIVSEYYFTASEGVHGELIGALRRHSPTQSVSTAPLAECADQPSPLDLLTICVLVLKNGFTVTGESACASPENFNAEIGRTIARANALNKVWPLMGYALKETLNG